MVEPARTSAAGHAQYRRSVNRNLRRRGGRAGRRTSACYFKTAAGNRISIRADHIQVVASEGIERALACNDLNLGVGPSDRDLNFPIRLSAEVDLCAPLCLGAENYALTRIIDVNRVDVLIRAVRDFVVAHLVEEQKLIGFRLRAGAHQKSGACGPSCDAVAEIVE